MNIDSLAPSLPTLTPQQLAALEVRCFASKKQLSYGEANYVFVCNFTTGALFWKNPAGRKTKPGTPAGTVNSQGYLQVQYKRQIYRVHHIVFLLFYKRWPEFELDHKDGNKLNNCPDNLTDHVDNHKNLPLQSRNKTGVIGVWQEPKSQKYHAYIRVNGKRYHLGSFTSLDEAKTARLAAEERYGFSPNHGKYESEARQIHGLEL
jgi:Drexlerviridae HNH endonuclease